MLRLYKKYLKKYKIQVFLGPLFKLVEAVFELLVPLIIGRIINEGLNNPLLSADEKTTFILEQGGLLLLFAVVGLCSTLVCQFFASRASQGFGTVLRDDLFKHINTLSFKELDELTASSLLTRMNSDINNLQQSVAMLIRLVVRAPFIVIGATILSFILSIKAGLIFLGTGIILFFVIFLIMFYTIPRNRLAQKKLDTITTITKENLSGNRIVRAFSRQKDEFKRFVDESEELQKIQNRLGKINALLNPMTFIITNLAIVGVLWMSGFEFKIGSLDQGNITSLYNYLLQIQLAIMVVANLVVIFTKASASATRVNEVFQTKSSIINGHACECSNDIPFVFENVSFKYNANGKAVLNHLNFEILPNTVVGIIGSTGSGKTSLVHLMNRFYDVDEGQILFYGKNIKDYNLSFINQNIALVMQKATLFSGTIADNLRWGKKNASDIEIKKALEVAQAKEFVDLMDAKENTMLYQGGANLSGGQKQRLSIARAIVKDSPILILDDSSSALDFKTEQQLRNAIKNLNKTTIIISQRASSIMYADQILVLDQGNLVGIGKHEELLNNCPVYQEICDSQDLGGMKNEK
ncbi:MAG: ABC transporter ATP-binding protein/permease [Anaeroplasmataceae bacterium]|nr:ABC transporter ATP-binding protein/permease [Anaeroplasmataceae bacterium]